MADVSPASAKRIDRIIRARIARSMAAVALCFAFLTAGGLWVAWFDEGHSASARARISYLKKEIASRPDAQALRDELGALDQSTRERGLWRERLREGGRYLLAADLLVFLLALHVWNATRPWRPCVRTAVPDAHRTQRQARALLAGLAAFALLLLPFLLSQNAPPRERLDATPGGTADAVTDPGRVTATGTMPAPQAQDARFQPGDEEWARNWPCFHGPGGSGVYDALAAPDPANLRVLAKIPLERPGFGSPILWNDRIFLTSAAAQDAQYISCYGNPEGQQRWELAVPPAGGATPARTALGGEAGLAAATPVTDGRFVVAIFGTGDIAAATADGALAWSRNLGVPDNHYGYASSLALTQGLAIVQYDNAADRRLLALDVATGKTVWQTPRAGDMSWSSPVVMKHGDKATVLTAASPDVIAYDAATGAERWRIGVLTGEVAPSPTYDANAVYAAMENAGLFRILPAAVKSNEPQAAPAVSWKTMDDLPDTSSPLVHGNRVWIAASYGRLTCLHADTGETLFTHDTDAGYYASPAWAGGLVWLPDREGTLHVLIPGDSWNVAAAIPLGEPVVASPAFSPDAIWLRGDKHLFRIGASP